MAGPGQPRQPRQPRQAQVSELIRTVRQARQYRPDPVPEDVLADLLRVAQWTGSSRNSQPWHFIVVTDKETLRRLSELRPPIAWMAGAPLGIAIVLDGANPISEAYDEGRVTERLLIAARNRGLGGGVAWYGDEAQQAAARKILGIPEDRTARAMVLIGYPVSTTDPRPTRATPGRKPLSELVSYNRWGAPQA
jgi:nitroreductase